MHLRWFGLVIPKRFPPDALKSIGELVRNLCLGSQLRNTWNLYLCELPGDLVCTLTHERTLGDKPASGARLHSCICSNVIVCLGAVC